MEPDLNFKNTRCQICSKLYSLELMFPCGHGYCKSCSISIFKNSTSAESLKCLTCQKSTYLSTDFIDPLIACQMSVPVSTDDIVGSMDGFSREDNSCSVCSRKGESKSCSYKCLDCLDRLCHSCSKGHLASSSTVSHRIVPFAIPSPESASPEIGASRNPLCDKHDGKEISLYCKSCRLLLCLQCALFDHMNHERCTIQEATDIAKERIHSVINERTIRLSELESQRDKALAQLNTLKESETKILGTLNSECESIILKILAERSAITQKITSAFASQKEELLMTSNFIQPCVKLARDTLITCTNALSSDDIDMLILNNSLDNGLMGMHETEDSLFQMCTPHKVPLMQLRTQTPNWPIFTIETVDSNSEDTSIDVSEVVLSEKDAACNSDNKNSPNTKNKHMDVPGMKTFEKSKPFKSDNDVKSIEANKHAIINDVTELNTKPASIERLSFVSEKQLNMDDVCDDHNKHGNVTMSLSTKAKHTKHSKKKKTRQDVCNGQSKTEKNAMALSTKGKTPVDDVCGDNVDKTGNNTTESFTKAEHTKLGYINSKETNSLEDVSDGNVYGKTANNAMGSVTQANNSYVESFDSKETKDCDDESNGPRKKKIYVPKGFYKRNKQAESTQNFETHDSTSNSSFSRKSLHGSLMSLHIPKELEGSSQTSEFNNDTARQETKWTDVCGKRPVSTNKKTMVRKSSLDAETLLSHHYSFSKTTFTKSELLSEGLNLPSTYSDAVKVYKKPVMVKHPQLTLSFHQTFDTAVKKDVNETEIKGLCFYEDDRILIYDRGNRKLKNVLKDGKQPHNRQFEDDVKPDRIVAIDKNIACISENYLYIFTKNVEMIRKLVLCDSPPKEGAAFSFCLTAIDDDFIVGNLPGNKLKTYRATTGKGSLEFDCPVKPPIASMSSTSKRQLLICSWRGQGCIHLVDFYGKEYQRFIRPGLQKAKERWLPNDACSNSRGYVFAADYIRSEINVFSPQGELILAYSTEADGLEKPHRLIVDTDDKLYVSGDGSHIVVYNIK